MLVCSRQGRVSADAEGVWATNFPVSHIHNTQGPVPRSPGAGGHPRSRCMSIKNSVRTVWLLVGPGDGRWQRSPAMPLLGWVVGWVRLWWLCRGVFSWASGAGTACVVATADREVLTRVFILLDKGAANEINFRVRNNLQQCARDGVWGRGIMVCGAMLSTPCELKLTLRRVGPTPMLSSRLGCCTCCCACCALLCVCTSVQEFLAGLAPAIRGTFQEKLLCTCMCTRTCVPRACLHSLLLPPTPLPNTTNTATVVWLTRYHPPQCYHPPAPSSPTLNSPFPFPRMHVLAWQLPSRCLTWTRQTG